MKIVLKGEEREGKAETDCAYCDFEAAFPLLVSSLQKGPDSKSSKKKMRKKTELGAELWQKGDILNFLPSSRAKLSFFTCVSSKQLVLFCLHSRGGVKDVSSRSQLGPSHRQP